MARELREFRSPTDGETRMFYEIVIAPSYTPEGLATLKGKSKVLRILEAKPRAPSGRSLRQVWYNVCVQASLYRSCHPEKHSFLLYNNNTCRRSKFSISWRQSLVLCPACRCGRCDALFVFKLIYIGHVRCFCFQNQIKYLSDIAVQKIFFSIIEINNSQGVLTDISANCVKYLLSSALAQPGFVCVFNSQVGLCSVVSNLSKL